MIRIRSLRCVLVPRRLTGQGPEAEQQDASVSWAGPYGFRYAHGQEQSHQLLKRIRYSLGRFTGRTTSETLRLRLDTVLPMNTKPFHITPEEMTFLDFQNFVATWLEENPPGTYPDR